MTSRRISALVTLPAALLLAACSSSTSGKGSTGAASNGGRNSGGSSVDAAALGAKMQAAVASVTSAHIDLAVQAAGQNVTGTGDEQLSGGKLVALDLNEALPGGAGSIRIIIVDGKTYAKLPTSVNPNATKPYVLVTKDSSNPIVRQLASSLDSALSSASVGSVGAFVAAARSVQQVGNETVNGVSTTHYSVVVDVSKLPSSLPGRDALVSSGLATIPFEIYLDGQGRPVKVTENFKVSGQQVSTNVAVGNYNQPVTIAAPPADQVGS